MTPDDQLFWTLFGLAIFGLLMGVTAWEACKQMQDDDHR